MLWTLNYMPGDLGPNPGPAAYSLTFHLHLPWMSFPVMDVKSIHVSRSLKIAVRVW